MLNVFGTHNRVCMCFCSENQGISAQTPISSWNQVGVRNGGCMSVVTRWNERQVRSLAAPVGFAPSTPAVWNNTVCSFTCVCLFVHESIYKASISSYSSALIIDSVRCRVGKCALYLIARRAQAGGVTLGREQAKWSHAQWYYWCTIRYCFLSPLPSHPAKSL